MNKNRRNFLKLTGLGLVGGLAHQAFAADPQSPPIDHGRRLRFAGRLIRVPIKSFVHVYLV